MKTFLIFIFLTAFFMPVITQKTGLSEKYPFSMKMLCSFMFLVTGITAVVSTGNLTPYSIYILFALVAGVLGDFFLSYKNEKYFIIGVICFAAGHLLYSYTYLFQCKFLQPATAIPLIIAAAIATSLLFIFARYKMNLKKLLIPLTIYAFLLIFSFVCTVACGIIAITRTEIYFGFCVITGASLFLFSDILLGLNMGGIKLPRFLRHGVSYTYFPAQTLFALSIFLQ